MHYKRLVAVILCLLLLSAMVPGTASAQVTLPVSGSGAGSTFTGTLTLLRFVVQNGSVFAVGTLSGVLKSGSTTTSVLQMVSLPVTVGNNATCDILHLELGPLDLNLLGLMIHLDKIVLDITAQAGGGLLGNLLCSIANALNDPNSLVRLLNQLLDILG